MKVQDIMDYLISIRDEVEGKKFTNAEILQIVGALQFSSLELMFRMNPREPPAMTYKQWRDEKEKP